MSANQPLTGSELVDCAKANSKELIDTVAYRCGYGEDISSFEQQLKASCREMGIDINSFYDLKQFEQQHTFDTGVEIAPDTVSEL